MSLNLQDWMGVANQINNTTQVRQQDQRIDLDRERTAQNQQGLDMAAKANERQWGREDKEDTAKSQEAAATNFFIEHPDLIEPGGGGQGGQSGPGGPGGQAHSLSGVIGGITEQPTADSPDAPGNSGIETRPTSAANQPSTPSLARAVQPQTKAQADPLAGMDPEAVRRARINAMEYMGKKALADGYVRENIKAKAADMTGKYRGALSQAWQMLREGDEAGGWDAIINGFNQFQPNGSTARREEGQLIMTDPTGKERAVAMPNLASFLRTEFARVNEDTTTREMVGSQLFGLKHNGDNARDGVFELYTADGQVGGYAVQVINPATMQSESKVYDRKPGIPGSVELTQDEVNKLMPKEELEAARNGGPGGPPKQSIKVKEMDDILQKAFMPKTELGVIPDPNGQAKYIYAQQYALEALNKGWDPYKAAAMAGDTIRKSEANYWSALKNFPAKEQQEDIRQKFQELYGYLPEEKR